MSKNYDIGSYQTLENCLFGAVTLIKHADIDKHKYSEDRIGFDRKGCFSHPSGRTGRNVIIFGVDMSSSTKIDNRKKYILILGKDLTQELEHTLSSVKMYSMNFIEQNKNLCLSLHYNEVDSYLLMVQELLNSKQTFPKL